ncbi:MAG: threonine/serine exporter family protein [Acidobacteriota bacterium]
MNSPDGPSQDPAASPEISLVLRLGKALHTYGYPSPLLESALGRITERFGLESQFFSTPTSLFCAFGGLEHQRTYLLRVDPGDVDLGKLAQLQETIDRSLSGAISPAEAGREVERIVASVPIYPPWLSILAVGLAAGGAALFTGGGLRELAVSILLGLLTAGCGELAGRQKWAPGILQAVASAVVAFAAAAAAYFAAPVSVYIITLAGLIVLLPGFTLTVSLVELATRHLASGTARLMGALITFLAIGFGVAAGRLLAAQAFGPIPSAIPLPPPGWAEWLAFLIAPLSFTVLLRAAPRDAPWIVLVGFIAVESGRLGSNVAGPELGMFVGALAVSLTSALYTRLRHRPAEILLVPGIFLLVPGSIGFRSVEQLLGKDVVVGVETAFRMVFVAVALMAGMLIGNGLVPRRRRSQAT